MPLSDIPENSSPSLRDGANEGSRFERHRFKSTTGSSRWKKTDPNRISQKSEPGQGKANPELNLGNETSKSRAPKTGNQPRSSAVKLDDGWDGHEHDPKLPNPHWKQDRSNFPAGPFLDAIYVIVSDEVRVYCENLWKVSDQYRLVMEEFPDSKEMQIMSLMRKKCNQVAWELLADYIECWNSGQPLSAERQAIFNVKFEIQRKFNPLDVRDMVVSIGLDKIEDALGEARMKASIPIPELMFEPYGRSKVHRSTKVKWQKLELK